MLGVSHVSVINWVKKVANKLQEKDEKISRRTDVLELDEMCVRFKKTSRSGQQ